MHDRKTVIRGLEHCKIGYCDGCPYEETIEDSLNNGRRVPLAFACNEQLTEEILALLKEQEPRVLDWDEIKNYSVVWGEFRGVKDIYPLIVTLDNEGRPLSWNPNINISDEFLFIVYDEEDRKNTRCWNHEPSDEQRQAVKWDDA